MQHDSNPQTAQPETSVSNAVLTPEQIHPNFFKMKKTHPHVHFKRKAHFNFLVPLPAYEIAYRKRWAARQEVFLKHIPSTAVLGA